MQPWRCAFLCAPQRTCAQRRTPARSEIRRLAQIGQHATVPFAASSIINSSQVGWRGEPCRQADDEARAAREQRRHEDPGVGIERIAVVNVLLNQPPARGRRIQGQAARRGQYTGMRRPSIDGGHGIAVSCPALVCRDTVQRLATLCRGVSIRE